MQEIMDAPGVDAAERYRLGVTDEDDCAHWTELRSDSAKGYWFNKRTGETQWDKPADVIAEEQRVPEVWEHLNVYLSATDKRGLGEAKEGQVWALMNDSELDLNPNQLKELKNAMEWSDSSGRVELSSFVHHSDAGAKHGRRNRRH